MTNMIYAIGDIHGRIDLLRQLHDHIRDFHRLQHGNVPADVIYIGDYIDGGAIVVHGHTPGDEPVVKPNRICVNTGATSNGILTAAVLDGKSPPLFLRAMS